MILSLSTIRRHHDRRRHAEAYSALVELLDDPETPDELVWALRPLESELAALVPNPGVLEPLKDWLEKRKASRALPGVKK